MRLRNLVFAGAVAMRFRYDTVALSWGEAPASLQCQSRIYSLYVPRLPV